MRSGEKRFFARHEQGRIAELACKARQLGDAAGAENDARDRREVKGIDRDVGHSDFCVSWGLPWGFPPRLGIQRPQAIIP